jgi:hypothetical protein
MPALTTIQLRRGSSTLWASSNSPLAQGELGYDTTIKRFKIGDGTSLWGSLSWANITGADFVGTSGINFSYASASGTMTVSVTGLSSSYLSDFSSAVSGLLPVKSIIAGNNITITPTGDKGFIISSPVNSDTVKDLIGSTITGVSGIRASYDNTGKVETISVTGLVSSYIGDFNTSVSGLVNGIYAPLSSPALTGTPTVPTATADTNTTQIASTAFVIGQASSSNPLMDGTVAVGTSKKYARADHVHPTDTTRAALAGATFTGAVSIPNGTGNFNTLTVNSTAVSLNGHTHTSSNITDFNTAVSGLIGVKSLVQGSGIGIVNNAGAQTISITGIPSSLITDLGNIATTQVIGRTGIALSYDAVSDTMYIDTTGVSFNGHTHTWSNITDASTKATLTELSYLSGVVPGTVSASRALIVDSSKNLTGINTLTTASDVTVGGNLTVQGTTTTVNSTTINIADNIIRVNTSGLSTGGMEVYTGSATQSVVWNNVSNRWEFSGGNVYTSGNFVGNLNGNASTVTNGVYTTDTGTVTSTMIADNTIVNADINSSAAIAYSKLNLSASIVNADVSNSAAIADSKLATISTAGKVSNSATTATNANTASAIVSRDASGNFSAGTITANLSGNATSVTNGVYTTDTGTVTNTMLAGSIANNKLTNSSVTIGSTSVSLGATVTSFAGLSTVTATTFVGSLSGTANNVITNANLTGPITSIGNATTISTGVIDNSHINPTAAIAYSKLNLSSSIVNADINNSAAIAYSKLNLAGNIVNSDINTSAAIAYSKLNLSSSVNNSDIATNAAIAYSKLNLVSGITNNDISATGAIAYSKLNLSTSIVNADIAASAAIVDTKLATISTSGKVSNSATTATSANTASAIVARDSSGNFSAGTITASLSGNATSVTNGVYTTDTGTVTNNMLTGSIANAKLLYSSLILGSTSISLGGTISSIAGLTSISGVSAASPTSLVYCLIDGGTP